MPDNDDAKDIDGADDAGTSTFIDTANAAVDEESNGNTSKCGPQSKLD